MSNETLAETATSPGVELTPRESVLGDKGLSGLATACQEY